MNSLKFTKMHCAGNDFMVIDGINQAFTPDPLQIQKWAHRQFSIGFNRFLIVEKSEKPENDFKFRIFDADGKEAQFYGNDICCLVHFTHDKHLTKKQNLLIEVGKKVISTKLISNNQIQTNIGQPIFSPAQIPFKVKKEAITYPIVIEEQTYEICCLNLNGQPYAILTTEDVICDPISAISEKIGISDLFPRKTNIIFMQNVSYCEISIREFENDGIELYPSGNAVCAAAIAGIKMKELDSPISVYTRGSTFETSWSEEQEVLLTGSAVTIYEGEVQHG